MKKNNFRHVPVFVAAFLTLTAINISLAQENKSTPPPSPQTQSKIDPQPPAAAPNPLASIPEANPADVSSTDAIIKALYSVISGDAGQKRDWNRFRSLFYPGARLIPTFKNKEGKFAALAIMPEEYVERSSSRMAEEGFFESELARRVENFGPMTHVFSTYQSKHKAADEKPFARGINSIQLLNDGKRWWILTIAWSGETPETSLPEKYLKSGGK